MVDAYTNSWTGRPLGYGIVCGSLLSVGILAAENNRCEVHWAKEIVNFGVIGLPKFQKQGADEVDIRRYHVVDFLI